MRNVINKIKCFFAGCDYSFNEKTVYPYGRDHVRFRCVKCGRLSKFLMSSVFYQRGIGLIVSNYGQVLGSIERVELCGI